MLDVHSFIHSFIWEEGQWFSSQCIELWSLMNTVILFAGLCLWLFLLVSVFASIWENDENRQTHCSSVLVLTLDTSTLQCHVPHIFVLFVDYPVLESDLRVALWRKFGKLHSGRVPSNTESWEFSSNESIIRTCRKEKETYWFLCKAVLRCNPVTFTEETKEHKEQLGIFVD